MTDKVQKIREEIEKLHKEYRNKKGALYYRKALRTVLYLIDSMQEEPVSEDLGVYINELSKQFSEVSFAKLSRIAVRVAKWQKEQMMAKAIDAQCFGFQGAALFSFRLPSDKYLVGSNVKVILINE